MLCLFLLFARVKGAFLRSYPSLYHLSKTNLCQSSVRLLCGFAQISLILLCILLKLDFLETLHVAYLVFAVALVGALIYIYSLKYRCITNLMTVLFLGRSGRALLITLLLTLVVSGVVQNLWSNSVEMVRVFVCTTAIHIRLTRMKFELLTTPFVHQFDNALQSRTYLEEEVARMTAFVQPAIEAVENRNPNFVPDNSTKETEPQDPNNVTALQYVQNYRDKLHAQCLYQIGETQRVCRQNYSHLYLDCVQRVTLIQSYCDVFKVENYCSTEKIISGSTPETFCNPTDVVPQQMGPAYRTMIESRNRVDKARQTGNVSYNITNLPTLPGIEEIKQTADDIKEHIASKKRSIDVVLYFLSFVDVVIIINLVIKTLSYYNHYAADIDYDNIYLTDELRQIDKDRAQRGLPSVLPLKHFERDFYVDPMRKQLRRREWFSISYGLLYMILIVLGVSGLFLVDWIYYTGLDVVRDNALVNFTQSGSFNFTLTVNGTGLLARIIRNATNGLNFTEFQSMNETNAKCLPNPMLTEWQHYVTVYALAALILYMNVNLMYSQRMMSVICGHFFPRRRQMRTKYLYNQMLIRRRIYFESLLNLLGEDVKQAHNFDQRNFDKDKDDGERVGGRGRGGVEKPQMAKGIAWAKQKLETLFKRFGDACERVADEKCGGKVKSSSVCCAVCQERENIAETDEFLPCGFDGCPLRYCASCWQNLKHRCVVYYEKEGRAVV